MDLVDAQVHIWEADSPGRPWHPSRRAARAKLLGAAAAHEESAVDVATMVREMDRVGVAGAILVTTTHYGWDPGYSLEAAATHPTRFRVVHRVDPDDPAVAEHVAEFASAPQAAGLRLLVMTDEQAGKLDSNAYDPLIRAVRTAGLPLCVFPPRHLDAIERLARRWSDLPIVIDHLGMAQPPLMAPDDPPLRDIDRLVAMSGFEQVCVKLTAAPTLSRSRFPYDDLGPPLRGLIDAFGCDRLMWGSDWQRVRPLLSLDQGVAYLRNATWLTEPEKDAIMAANARRVFCFSK